MRNATILLALMAFAGAASFGAAAQSAPAAESRPPASTPRPAPQSDLGRQHRHAGGIDITVRFSELDLDSDDRLSPEEVRGDVDLRQRFETLDRDGDGYLSYSEASAHGEMRP